VAAVNPRGPLSRFVISTHRFSVGGNDVQRLQHLVDRLRWLDREHRVERVVVELPTSLYVPRGRGLEALKVLLAIGAVVGWAEATGLRVTTLAVDQWKGRRNHDKQLSVQLAGAIWPDLFWPDDHMAEAALLALAAVQPDAVRAGFVLLRQGWGPEKALAPFRAEWTLTDQDLARLEAAEMGLRSRPRRRGH
jgi:hypothetical protein